ncbi:MAG: SDR family NAD(P)-dependent oxidoreductase [Alphaproteobacteria bacterium]|jgi:NAD(P)-dependent dehydrogenase (short-subunit alcohol dehydrogenase family)|nr:SDR family NAD(P)-dependent oxidoreductase [Alphaproteobacteria bacterium]
MAFTVDIDQFRYGADTTAFVGKHVLVTGSGRDQGLGQAFALAAGLNGAASVGVHFHRSYRDGFDLVDALRDAGVNAFALQADVTNNADLWASRTYVVEQMGGRSPDIVICNSGLTEQGYRFGRALPEQEGESRGERRARVRRAYIENLEESRAVLNTKIDGFVALTHLWAAEAVYHGTPVQLVYISSKQALEPGVAVPGYVIANWAVLQLPQVLRVNLGRAADMASAYSLLLPFVRTSMTEEYSENERVFGRWQPRMLETHEAAAAVAQLLSQSPESLDQGLFELNVGGTPERTELEWAHRVIEVRDEGSRGNLVFTQD